MMGYAGNMLITPSQTSSVEYVKKTAMTINIHLIMDFFHQVFAKQRTCRILKI